MFVGASRILVGHTEILLADNATLPYRKQEVFFSYISAVSFFLFGDKQRREVLFPPYLYRCLEPGEPGTIWEQMKSEGSVINEVAEDSELAQITVSLANNKLQT